MAVAAPTIEFCFPTEFAWLPLYPSRLLALEISSIHINFIRASLSSVVFRLYGEKESRLICIYWPLAFAADLEILPDHASGASGQCC